MVGVCIHDVWHLRVFVPANTRKGWTGIVYDNEPSCPKYIHCTSETSFLSLASFILLSLLLLTSTVRCHPSLHPSINSIQAGSLLLHTEKRLNHLL